MSRCTALHTETRVLLSLCVCLKVQYVRSHTPNKQGAAFHVVMLCYCWEYKVSACINSSCSICSSARWNWWQHPDEDHGVEERGGHVGHQSQLQEDVWSVSVQHHPGTLSAQRASLWQAPVASAWFSDVLHTLVCSSACVRAPAGCSVVVLLILHSCRRTDGVQISDLLEIPCSAWWDGSPSFHQSKWMNVFSWGQMFSRVIASLQ